jgi:FkbM family methyltransferase
MRRRRVSFYGGFIGPGDIVFDVGANVGERSEVFLELGASVVAVEPQSECTELLVSRWGAEPRFILFEGACAEAKGERELFIATASTLSSMAPAWIDAVSRAGMFEHEEWKESRLVTTTTLDALIAEHGVPRFVKIDVEGFEHAVLSGLTQPVALASLEWHGVSLEATSGCIEHLTAIGMAEFNVSLGESMEWALPRWVDGGLALERMRNGGELAWGDLYARQSGAGRAG